MGVGLALENFDKLYHTEGRSNKVIVNDLKDTTKQDRAAIENLLYTRYESTDFISNIPSCECTKSTGEYALNSICPYCNTPVMNIQSQNLESLVWMRGPRAGDRLIPLINPNFLSMLISRFKLKGFDVISWFCDTTYKPPRGIPAELEHIAALGFPRGLINFEKNFDNIMEGLLGLKVYRRSPKAKKEEADALPQLIQEYRDCLFSKFLPLPNRALIVIEDTNLGIYADTALTGAVNAMQAMINIDSPLNTSNIRTRENRTYKTLLILTGFYSEMYSKRLAPKEGMFRKHVYGSRAHWSFRGVISSITDQHEYDEVHVSWGIAISVLELHLSNKLLKRGWTPFDITSFLYEHSQKYHPFIDELFKELIAESPWKGIPIIFQRNPSLERGSAQAMFITQVKTDVDIPTISMSILAVSGFNADFDGDQQNGTLSIDYCTTEDLQRLAPSMSTFGFDGVKEISRNLSIPKPVVSTMASWLHWPEEPLTQDEAMRMAAIPDA